MPSDLQRAHDRAKCREHNTRIAELESKLAIANATIEKLPKTADGVVVLDTCGKVFAIYRHQSRDSVLECGINFNDYTQHGWGAEYVSEWGERLYFDIAKTYSTLAAADAAKEQDDDK